MKLLVVLACGCGRIGFEPRADAAPDLLTPFSPATPLSINSPSLDDDPSLTDDMLELYFESGRPGGSGMGDIWVSTRTGVGAPWQPPVAVLALNTASNEEHPDVSGDGLTLILTSSRGGTDDLFVSTRPTRADPWSAPSLVADLSSAAAEHGATMTADMRLVYFASNRGTNFYELYRSQRAAVSDSWEPPIVASELSSASAELSPFLRQAGLLIAFASARAGVNDLYWATRNSTDVPFDPPTLIPGIDTSAQESDPWLSPDLRVIFYSVTNASGDDLYMATR